ncbi:allantoicase [Solihabitans fulvus]|uniref:Probable allantoicase n=1 Tax=Solihabitans fulvus TaxID=1892852 RepID=A0A5B2WUT5_9PSEU|nr:allantoicase [Solihabitans fulvus]KAA2253637.1 allantoicase [Solihabitans fulvus]
MSEQTWTQLPDLASRAVGGSVVWANDEFFAERENLIKPAEPIYQTYTFGHKGQVYDGWETRRRREAGDDRAVIRLGLPGVLRGVVIDTAFFVGNYPPHGSVEACAVDGYPSGEELAEADWETVVPKASLRGGEKHYFDVTSDRRYTHVRLTIYPDGGVARLRVYGEPVADPRFLLAGALDLAALEYGARITGCSNRFFSAPNNLLAPGQATVMGEGWETARRRDEGNDWVSVQLAGPGSVRLAELDTSHFKGNAPGWASVVGCDGRVADPSDPTAWFDVLPRTRLQPDTRHRFRLAGDREVTHVRLDIYPDGGMARLRLFGALTKDGQHAVATGWFNRLPHAHGIAVLTGEAGLTHARATELLAARPLTADTSLPEELATLLG